MLKYWKNVVREKVIISWVLAADGRRLGGVASFPHMTYYENWGLNSMAQKCLYGSCEKLQHQGQAICWDAG